MGRPPRQDANTLTQALNAVRKAEDFDHLRVAQATLLPLLGLTLEQTAQSVGEDRYWVSRARNGFLRGDPPPKQHGGRRRSLVPESEEVTLLKQAITKRGHRFWEIRSVRNALREILEERTSDVVSESALTAMLNRASRKLFPGLPIAELESLSVSIVRMWFLQEKLQAARDSCCT